MVVEQKICICDEDAQYVNAFASYLMERLHGVSIYSYTSTHAFLESGETFSIGILGKEFLNVLEFSGKELVGEKFYLCDERIAAEYEHLPMVYKYQSMEIVEEMIQQYQKKQEGGSWELGRPMDTSVYGIFSPICHELQMPFAFAVCQIFRERGRVLFIDLEDISIMKNLIHQPERKNIMDLLYHLSRTEEEGVDIREYIISFMGIDLIPPFHNPEEFNEVESQTWECFFSMIVEQGYEFVVILFGRTMQGFRNMLSCCRELILLNKPGDYYRMSQNRFLEYMEENRIHTTVEPMLLPMSAGNLVEGAYDLEELIQGNLGMYVRRQFHSQGK